MTDRPGEPILAAFEANWTPETSGPAGIAVALLPLGSRAESHYELLVELILFDMQAAWSDWATRALASVHAGEPADRLLDRWKAVPRFQNYAVLFRGPEDVGPYWNRMASQECVCRDRWGDAVGSLYYKHYFQAQTQDFLRRVRRHMRCQFEDNSEYSQVLYPLRGTNEIGRQRSGDVEAYFCESRPEGNRIVIASRAEAEISRHQLSLQLMTPAVAVVVNRSRINCVRLSTDVQLEPGQLASVEFPFTIQLPGRRLSCY